MKHSVWFVFFFVVVDNAAGIDYSNSTLDPASRQLLDFKLRHPKPIGVLTTSAGMPVEVRDTVSLNTDVFDNAYFYDQQTSIDQEPIPERTVHAKGAGAYGYFEVTNDVSKYTSADVFNGIGKRTPVAVRFSLQVQDIGGVDLSRETHGLVAKFYTQEGNLDLLGLSFPVYLYRDPNGFTPIVHSFKRNPQTHLYDATARLNAVTLIPDSLPTLLWLFSDYGIVNGYRKFDVFPIHTYELSNKHGESHYVRFNFRTEQGLEFLTDEAASALRSQDPDYSERDLFNAISTGNFPSWRLDIDVMSEHQVKNLHYNPFDVTRMWENGTYHTVTIGRLVLNKNPDNFFKDVEQAAYNPGNLVPGIPGPPDVMFRARRLAYRDAQNNRLGINHNNIKVNCPLQRKVYNRDGMPPVLDNMRDAPNYYQNSFNGPVPYVDVARPKNSLLIYDRNAVDLQVPADFYNKVLKTEGQKNRLAANLSRLIVRAIESVQKKILQLLTLIDRDLGHRVRTALVVTRAALVTQQPTLTVIEEYPKTLGLVPPTPSPPKPFNLIPSSTPSPVLKEDQQLFDY
ncbi:hypothetical protein MSG28_015098 [Choristoneura fumiferana]|uniref:Uncharacterized protein n=1 Tax=Choristoneura fumiferana TaxID=7141 RepID=A0ACC0KYX2_CHOFU|nr:hypothetical protein MSG28_015098 [Choristoneura fumiferana]